MSLPACTHAYKPHIPPPGHHWPGEIESGDTTDSQRQEILKLLDKWVNTIEDNCGLKKDHLDPCEGCFPEFTCFGNFYHKKPFCLKPIDSPLITNIPIKETRPCSEKKRVVDQDPRVTMKLVGVDKVNVPPVWERPRVHSQILVGGEYRKLTDCFKNNGLTSFTGFECPRTKSCRKIKTLKDWVDEDRKQHATQYLEPVIIECCCCQGETSRLPMVKCVTCAPPGSNKKSTKPCSSKEKHIDRTTEELPGWANCFAKKIRESGQV